ncbi:MAG: tripartite tricarboxylate transporter receptor family protein [Betaproteobacteria bacterium]|nr:tripartite tricarboxylate transporter receptor family protein [Betaproteobacteria bacterium]
MLKPLTACAMAALVAGIANAQSYPAKPVRMIVPFAIGGGTDIVARAVALEIGKALNQSFVVDNKTGANGNIGMEIAAKAPPDGYTLIMTSSALAINPSMYKGLGYDAVNDFAPVSLATLIPFILVANSALPAKSVKELVALARARKKELSYASSGTGNATHLAMALLEMMTKIELNHIPYKGTGQGVTDVMGGHVPLMFGALPSTMPGVKAGKLRILAISSTKRSPVLPDVPTVAEAGVPGYELTSWYGVLAPAGTPAAIVTQLNSEIVKALNTPEVRARLSGEGAEPVGNSPAEFQAYIRTEIDKYAKIVNALGIGAK